MLKRKIIMEDICNFNVGDLLEYSIPGDMIGKLDREVTWDDGTKETIKSNWEVFNHHRFIVEGVQNLWDIHGKPFRGVLVKDVTPNNSHGMFTIPKEQLSWFTKIEEK